MTVGSASDYFDNGDTFYMWRNIRSQIRILWVPAGFMIVHENIINHKICNTNDKLKYIKTCIIVVIYE